MILGLQVTALVFALIMVYMALVQRKRGELNGMEYAVWLLIWGITILATLFPELLRTYATAFAVTRLFDLMVVGGFIVVISLVSMAYIRVKRLERKLEKYVRQEALKDTTPPRKTSK